MSELATLCKAIIPLEDVVIGNNLKETCLSGFRPESRYHQSAMYSLVVDNMAYSCYNGKNPIDLRDVCQ